VFVIDYPAAVCPLTKRKADAPHVAERFELYVAGMELANAYTELNDPDLQEELFRTQLAGLDAEESMARMDTDFIRALRHGMPPAGGLGSLRTSSPAARGCTLHSTPSFSLTCRLASGGTRPTSVSGSTLAA
jgi:hypothetical protein